MIGPKAIQFESIDDAVTLREFRARCKNNSGHQEVPRMKAILLFHPYLPHLLRPEDAERPRWAGGAKSKSLFFAKRNESITVLPLAVYGRALGQAKE